jgi:abequosyltransferase
MQRKIFLSILIPTYNRQKQLCKNLEIVKSILLQSDFKNEVEIIISDNHSTDRSLEMLNSFDFDNLNYLVFVQKQNMGAVFNCLFLLEKSKGEFIMYLGDDDYLDKEYLNKIIPVLKADESIYCVIPATKSLYPSGEISPGRDYYKKSKIYNKGFKNCLENSWRGTQLSAVICRREDLYKTYLKRNVNNLYPFIYFVSYNCLTGKTWHMTECPVTITQMEKSTHIDYGSANLVPDIFDNYKKLTGITYFQRVLLEIKALREQPWRYANCFYKNGIKGLVNFIFSLLSDKSTSILTKILLPFVMLEGVITQVLRKVFRYFKPSLPHIIIYN